MDDEAKVINQIRVDEKIGTGNITAAWEDAYKYIYGPDAGDIKHNFPSILERAHQLKTDLEAQGLLAPFAFDSEGNIEFEFQSAISKNGANFRSATFAGGQSYELTPDEFGNKSMLVFHNFDGSVQDMKYDSASNTYREWDGLSLNFIADGQQATVDGDGNLTLTDKYHGTETYKINGDLVLKDVSDGSSSETTYHGNGIVKYVISKGTDTSTQIAYPDGTNLTSESRNGQLVQYKLDDSFGAVYDPNKNQWIDSNTNKPVRPPNLSDETQVVTFYAPDGESVQLNGTTMLVYFYGNDSNPISPLSMQQMVESYR